MEKKPRLYGEVIPFRRQLFEAEKSKNETLAQWASRLTKLGADAAYDDEVLTDLLLRAKFVTGLDPGPLDNFFRPRTDIYQLTYKQVLYLAFTTQAKLEKEAKTKNNPQK